MKIVHKAVVGSTAHGLARDDSDVDTIGIFVRPSIEFALLSYRPSSDTVHSVSETADYTYHELGKFLAMLLKNNPNTLDILLAEQIHYSDPIFIKPIKDNLSMILGHGRLVDRYTRMIASQIFEAQRTNSPTVFKKSVRNAVRLSRQGVRFINEGVYEIKVSDPDFYKTLWNAPDDEAMRIAEQEFAILKTSIGETGFWLNLSYDDSFKFANELLSELRSLA